MSNYSLEAHIRRNGDPVDLLEINVGRPLVLGEWFDGFKNWLEESAPENAQVHWWNPPGIVYATGSQLSELGWLNQNDPDGRSAEEKATTLMDKIVEERLGSAALEGNGVIVQEVFFGRSRNDPRICEVKLRGMDPRAFTVEGPLFNLERNITKYEFGLKIMPRYNALIQIRMAEVAMLDNERFGKLSMMRQPPAGILPKIAEMGPVGVIRQDLSYLLAEELR